MPDIKEEIMAGFKAIDEKVGKTLDEHSRQVQENGRATSELKATLDVQLKEHAEMRAELAAMNDTLTAVAQRGQTEEAKAAPVGVGSALIGSDSFASFKAGHATKARIDFQANTIVEGTGNTVTRHEQLPGVVPGARRTLSVMPTVATGTTASNVIYYSKELLWTNNAAETAENTTKPESVLTFEEASSQVRTIPHFLKVSKQALDDSSFLESYINSRMTHGVQTRIESQIVSGNGAGSNLSGWLASGNSTATDPTGTGNIFGLANLMKYEILAADYIPDYYYMNTLDWQKLEVIQRGTGDAAYVAATASVAYVNNGLTPMLWGLPVIVSNAVPAGTIICKSLDADMYFDRQSVSVEMFEQDGTNAQENLVTVRAEARGAVAVFAPAAIRTGAIASIT